MAHSLNCVEMNKTVGGALSEVVPERKLAEILGSQTKVIMGLQETRGEINSVISVSTNALHAMTERFEKHSKTIDQVNLDLGALYKRIRRLKSQLNAIKNE